MNPREEALHHPAASSKATCVRCALTCSPIIISFFDYYQGANRETEPLSIGGHLPLERVFAYESIPAALSEDEAKHVLGAQGQLWIPAVDGKNRIHGFSPCLIRGAVEHRQLARFRGVLGALGRSVALARPYERELQATRWKPRYGA